MATASDASGAICLSSAPVNMSWLPPSHSHQPTTNPSSSLRAVHIRRE
ncbi:MAG: hypothetical protein NZM04_09390 [Methylacidiphilales bacterium]|nr:hypothetical protein [Candidatus Methylacidiphilales bacterium]